jgi:hypothetical protein
MAPEEAGGRHEMTSTEREQPSSYRHVDPASAAFCVEASSHSALQADGNRNRPPALLGYLAQLNPGAVHNHDRADRVDVALIGGAEVDVPRHGLDSR